MANMNWPYFKYINIRADTSCQFASVRSVEALEVELIGMNSLCLNSADHMAYHIIKAGD